MLFTIKPLIAIKKKDFFAHFCIFSLQNPANFIMASVKLYFDKRARRKDHRIPLKVGITHKQDYAQINLDVLLLPEQWDPEKNKVINHPNKAFLNTYISKRLLEIELQVLKLQEAGVFDTRTLSEIRKMLQDGADPEAKPKKVLFEEHFIRFMENKSNPRTHNIYQCTLNKMKEYTDISTLAFEEINVPWLKSFEKFLRKTMSVNARSVYLRNIRAVFNDAIDEELTASYPFRKFKIKNERTPKRSLPAEQLCLLRDYACEEHQEQYRDLFMLIFYLVGINIIDLCHLKKISHGRIEYKRAKTGRWYSIKVEPEALELIKRYKGKNYLINIMDRYSNHKDYAHRLNQNLREIGEMKRAGLGGKKIREPLFPEISTYWARHT